MGLSHRSFPVLLSAGGSREIGTEVQPEVQRKGKREIF